VTVCFALVEGQTELAFLNSVVKLHLAQRGVTLTVGLPTKTGGGAPNWEATLRDIRGKLMERGVDFVTTMFDLYGLPLNWPGRQNVRNGGLKHAAAVQCIEKAIERAVAECMGQDFDVRRFISYIQQHEFEALLFSGPKLLAASIGCANLEEQFEAIRNQCGGCEEINDSEQTAPSKRIKALAPAFQKRTLGVTAAKNIGLSALRASCPHFNNWLIKLENLAENRILNIEN
jgi:hypothetical protein